jgi:hypothetical protein
VDGAENLASTENRSPDRPIRSESLYRLRYRGSIYGMDCKCSTHGGGIQFGSQLTNNGVLSASSSCCLQQQKQAAVVHIRIHTALFHCLHCQREFPVRYASGEMLRTRWPQ